MTGSSSTSDDAICARRGGQWLSQTDLRAHLAAGIRLENVGALLGAGASVGPLGGQTITQLWDAFSAEYADSLDWLKNNGFVQAEDSIPDIEKLADTIQIARIEWERQANGQVEELKSAQADLRRSVVKAAVLNEDWWRKPTLIHEFPDELSSHRLLLQKLTAARQPGQPSPWLFTTNYDLAIEWAAESLGLMVTNGFGGTHCRVFSPHNFDLGYTNTLARGEARFGTYNVYVAKLHGSLSWTSGASGATREKAASTVWTRLKKFIAQDSDAFGDQVVFPSAAKYLQTVGFVLGELFRRFTEFLARPQTLLLVSGYSFSDEHLNRLIISALQNPTLSLVAYVPDAKRTDDSLVVPESRPWIRRLAALDSPQVTIVGGNAKAHFEQLVRDLPDPAIYDDKAIEFRKLIQDLTCGNQNA